MSGHTHTYTHTHTHTHTHTYTHDNYYNPRCAHAHRGLIMIVIIIIMKSTKVQTLGGIWWKCWNIWIENTFACIRIIVLGVYRTSFQHNLHCFINACVNVVND